MRLTRPDADLYVPDGRPLDEALARTTHLAVGAHQDDIEFMALHGILECFGRSDRSFVGVTLTNGAGSARTGPYAACSNDEMAAIRVREQRDAALIGGYGCQIQLMYSSAELKDASNPGPVSDLLQILSAAKPQVVYLHNPADKHDTHVASCLRALAALRRLEPAIRPLLVFGCEVWRSLDWLPDSDKQVLPVDDRPNLAAALSGVFDSQISGGKRYDLAVQGRRLANATFFESHEVDRHTLLAFAVNLTPLVADPSLDVASFTTALIDRLRADVADRIARMSRGA
jgi:LmbE family N-acetylglucosaminyl deacetylase